MPDGALEFQAFADVEQDADSVENATGQHERCCAGREFFDHDPQNGNAAPAEQQIEPDGLAGKPAAEAKAQGRADCCA